jgi:hypothetical protein
MIRMLINTRSKAKGNIDFLLSPATPGSWTSKVPRCANLSLSTLLSSAAALKRSANGVSGYPKSKVNGNGRQC